MSITGNFVARAPEGVRQKSAAPGAGLAAALEAMARGMRAATEWDRLNRMSDSQLAARGLVRERLAEEILRRNFVDMG